MKTEIIYKIIGLIVLLNLCNEIYFRFGNHGWSKYGYRSYCFLSHFTQIINFFTGATIFICLLYFYFIEWQ